MGAESYFYHVRPRQLASNSFLLQPTVESISDAIKKINEDLVVSKVSASCITLSFFKRIFVEICINDELDISIETCLYYLKKAPKDSEAILNTLGIIDGDLSSHKIAPTSISDRAFFFSELSRIESVRYNNFMDNYAWAFTRRNILPGKDFYSSLKTKTKETLLKVSFDLDDTLICGDVQAEIPRFSWLTVMLSDGPLRKGTADLFDWLRRRGCSIGVYTSSYRSIWHLKLLFWNYGIKTDFLINQFVHELHFKNKPYVPIKNPYFFNIDIHIDDESSVKSATQNQLCQVILLSKNNDDWKEEIKHKVRELTDKTIAST